MDGGLLELVARGDSQAVARCVDRYGGLVYALARRFLRNAAEAEDAVQEIFIALWQLAGRFDPGLSSEPAFVTMIARRRLIDRQRRLARRRETAGDAPEALDRASPHPGSHHAVDVADEARRATAAIAQLPSQEQHVIRLAVLEGWSHARIAEELNLPLGTVKTQVRRALLRVRSALGAAPLVPEVAS